MESKESRRGGKASRGPKKSFKLRKSDRVGAAGAEEDEEFLKHCFVDTGDVDLLQRLNDPRIIVLGRTGTGKTALLNQLANANKERVIRIRPEQLALTYVADSAILRFFDDQGVNLNPFFGLLWRHVLTVEILLRHFDQDGNSESGRRLIDRLKAWCLGTTRAERESQGGQVSRRLGKVFLARNGVSSQRDHTES